MTYFCAFAEVSLAVGRLARAGQTLRRLRARPVAAREHAAIAVAQQDLDDARIGYRMECRRLEKVAACDEPYHGDEPS